MKPLRFASKEKRNELARRLMALSQHMQRSFDQGYDGRIAVSDEMIGDIQTAAACVIRSEFENGESVDSTTQGEKHE